MATELFSLLSGTPGWRWLHGDGQRFTSNLDGISVFHYSDEDETVERAFYRLTSHISASLFSVLGQAAS